MNSTGEYYKVILSVIFKNISLVEGELISGPVK